MKFSDLDQFRNVAAEYTSSTTHGGLVTLAVCCTAAIFASLEFVSFVTPVTRTELHVDDGSAESLLVDFNISFHDLECDYVGIGMRDFFSGGDHRLSPERVKRTPLDHNGDDAGRPYTEEEVFALDTDPDVSEYDPAAAAALDTDWKSSNDAAARSRESFERQLTLHDFTVVYYYIRSTKAAPGVHCRPCREWRPVWEDFAAALAASPEGRSGRVRALSINCADLVDACMDIGIGKVPRMRMYKRGLPLDQYSEFTGLLRTTTGTTLYEFFKGKYSSVYDKTNGVKQHSYFKQGCRVEGMVEVPKVPGTLHFEAVHGPEVTLNFALTNISHEIHHLSFSETDVPALEGGAADSRIPLEYRKGIAPLNGGVFATEKFHRAPHHFIKVVPTHIVLGDGVTRITTHQLTAQSNVVRVPRHETPSARITFDLSPVEVTVFHEHRGAWYDFFTTLFAVIGGAFTVLSVASTMLRSAKLGGM